MSGEPLPILVGLSGKRDLRQRDAAVRATLGVLLAAIERAFPFSPKVLVTGLAEGADMLAADVALSRPGWRVLGLLAFAEADFLDRFENDAARARFAAITADPRTRRVTLAPLDAAEPPLSADRIRQEAYEQLGLWLAENSTILVGVLPATEPVGTRLGGTSRVLARRCDGEGDADARAVVCRSAELAPHALLDPFDPRPACLIDLDSPGYGERLSVLVRREGRDATLGLDELAMRIALPEALAIEAYNLRAGARAATAWPAQALAADALAGRFRQTLSAVQGRCQAAWKRSVMALALLFFLAVTLLEAFAKFGPDWPFADALGLPHWGGAGYAALVLAGLALYAVVERMRWQRIHQDYRAVNEVLRVQRAWWAAGLSDIGMRADLLYLQGAVGALRTVRRGAAAMLTWIRLAADLPTENAAAVDGPKGWIPEQRRYFLHRAEQRERDLARIRIASWGAFHLALGLGLWLAAYGLTGGTFSSGLAKALTPMIWGIWAVCAFVALVWVVQGRLGVPHGEPRLSPIALTMVPGGLLLLGPTLYLLAGWLAPGAAASGKTLALVSLVVLLAFAGSIRFMSEKLVWEAEGHAYAEAHARFAQAERELERITAEGLDAKAARLRRQAVVAELGRRALAENEAWLRAHRERPVEPVVGG